MKFVLTSDIEVIYKSGRKVIYPNVSDFYYHWDKQNKIGYFVLSSVEFKSHQKCIDVSKIIQIGYVLHSCNRAS